MSKLKPATDETYSSLPHKKVSLPTVDTREEEYEVEIYEDEDGSFYYIDPDTGEEVPCDEDGNAL